MATMIDRRDIKNFWEARGKKFAAPTEAMANLESSPELLSLKVAQEQNVVLPRLDLKPDMDVLDIGAGYGQWSMRFAPHVRSVTAVEYADSMLRAGVEEAKSRNLANIHFIPSAAEDFIPEKNYQLVFISGLFLYLDDPQAEKVASMAMNALAPGGRLFLREAISMLDRRHVIENRWSTAMESNYSALYRLPEEFIQLFKKLRLVERGHFFPDGSPLNKWKETRLHFYLFAKGEDSE